LHNLSTVENYSKMTQVIIIGGGLAGLVSAIQLNKAGISCLVIEKKSYPFHRVCGEYISNEVTPFLRSLGIFPDELQPTKINRFQLSATNGKSSFLPLDLGGFGVSRYALDYYLYTKAKAAGVTFLLETEVESIHFNDHAFQVGTGTSMLIADVVLGSFGKRSRADVLLQRSFIRKRSPYVGVKYHIRTTFPDDLIALHNFEGGYCGVSNVENGVTNLCYLVHRDVVRTYKSISEMEKAVLFRNPHLQELFTASDFVFERPEVINEITFETKEPVYKHVLMAGDAAGMITPLCGNGMAMAIHSSKVVCEHIVRFFRQPGYKREQMEGDYANAWRSLFAARLWRGRQIQRLFGNSVSSAIAIQLVLNVKPLARAIVKSTHGEPF
jgi:menaquinone-9 beta-reductase